MTGGVSFDRATDYYDATRALPPDVRDAVADVVTRELEGRGPCLEIGAGTGRTALPLHERGIPLVGVDLSGRMLQRLKSNAGGALPFPLLVGDATELPIAPATVGAVLGSHILHLVPNWKAALDEARRVTRPGGVVLVDFGGGTPGEWDAPAKSILERHGIGHVRPGVSNPELVERYLGRRASMRALEPVTMTVRRSLAMDLDEWERQLHAWTWPYPADQMAAACDDVRAFAAHEGWSLDAEVELGRVIQWWAFDLI